MRTYSPEHCLSADGHYETWFVRNSWFPQSGRADFRNVSSISCRYILLVFICFNVFTFSRNQEPHFIFFFLLLQLLLPRHWTKRQCECEFIALSWGWGIIRHGMRNMPVCIGICLHILILYTILKTDYILNEQQHSYVNNFIQFFTHLSQLAIYENYNIILLLVLNYWLMLHSYSNLRCLIFIYIKISVLSYLLCFLILLRYLTTILISFTLCGIVASVL